MNEEVTLEQPAPVNPAELVPEGHEPPPQDTLPAEPAPTDALDAEPLPEETIEPYEDPREAIAKKFAQNRAKEFGLPAPGDEPQEGDPPADDEPPPHTDMVTVKVNGREKQVERSRVDAAGGIDAYQKSAAASELLNHAAAENRAAQQRKTALDERERALLEREARAVQPEAKPLAAPTQPPVDRKALAQQYHDALLDGRLDEASELFLQLGTQQAIPSADEIVEIAATRTQQRIEKVQQAERLAEAEADRKRAVANFAENYADIARDPMLVDLTNTETIKVRKEHPEWSPSKIIDESAKNVRKWMADRGIPTNAGTPAASSTLHAKRSMSPPVRGGSARAAARPAPKPPTPSQVVQQMRRDRGLDA